MDLYTAGLPGDPALDIAVSHALLEDVAARRRRSALRIFRPGPAAAFGRLDALRPGFPEATERARRRGLMPLVRLAGGRVAVYDHRCVIVEVISAEEEIISGLQPRFERLSERLRAVLFELGADARIGELPGEYCAGGYSVNLGGRIKVVGIAQRAIRRAALTSAIVVCGGGPELRAVIGELYGALGLAVDRSTAGSLDEDLPGASADAVTRAIQGSYAADHRLEPSDLDPDLLAAAQTLAARHRVA